MEDEFIKSNMELCQAQLKTCEKSLRSILSTIIRTMSRDELIKVLKSKKIIKHEYSEEKRDFVLIEREE